MAVASVNDLVDVLGRTELLTPVQLTEVKGKSRQFSEPRALAKDLLQRDWLTPFQINQLLQGNGTDLVLGQYVLLERIGEGGMGAVYKARHRRLDRVAALKVIRKERIANTTIVRRFQREIQAATCLNHPNIVRAFDADEVGGTHFLVMEYVEGTDLGQLIRTKGPLPVAQACELVRQAALGLQHVLENGLVHRDIKPSNFLVATDGTLKILDLGLARMRVSADGESISALTEEGSVMGTPDFLAPEQARNAVDVDIRADLYSLGCTFYFLLTGQVPFPDGTITEKLIHHQMDEPRPVEEVRRGIPRPVANIVRKLMAKQPAERFQTPRELVAALDSACKKSWLPVLQRRQWLLLAAGAGGLLLGALLVLLLWPAGSPWKKLDPKNIAVEDRYPGRPDDLVAVLGGKKFTPPRFPVNALASSPNGKYLATTRDDKVYIWDMANPDKPTLLAGHTGQVWAVAFAPDGKTLASANGDGQVKVWDLATAKELRGWNYSPIKPNPPAIVYALEFSPDGKLLAQTVVGDPNIRLWDPTTGKEITPSPQRQGMQGSFAAPLAFSPDSTRLACTTRDGKIQLCTLRAGSPEGKPVTFSEGHAKDVGAIVFSPDGKTLATASADNSVKLWDVEGKSLISSFSVSKPIIRLAFSPDGRMLAGSDSLSRIILWDVKSRSLAREWNSFAPGVWPQCVVFSPDSKYLAASMGTGAIYIYRLQK